MRTIRESIQLKLDSGTASLIDCAKITRKDGVTIYMADYPVDIVIGENLYLSTYGYQASAVNANASLSPDSVDVRLVLGFGITKVDVSAGLYDGAEVRTFTTDADDPLEDDIKNTRGFFGKAKLLDNTIVTEYVSLNSKLNQQVGEQTTPKCRAELGDLKCRVKLNPPVWSASTEMVELVPGAAEFGSVVKPTVSNGYYFSANIVVEPGNTGAVEPTWPAGAGSTVVDGDVTWNAFRAHVLTMTVLSAATKRIFSVDWNGGGNFWDYGTVKVLSGNNLNFKKEIKVQSGQTIQLFDAMPYAFEVGDTIEFTRGCQKRIRQDCLGNYNNAYNYRGEPFNPTKSEVFRFGGQ